MILAVSLNLMKLCLHTCEHDVVTSLHAYTRRLLQLWVQKQDEVIRGTRKLYEGLLKADRLRKTVLKWSKAEAHSGPNREMSDGEDWYDKEEWGLVDDLKKGHDEEEEDQQQTQKKTRNRK